MNEIVVVSTGYRPPTREKCERSVREQTVPHVHVVCDAYLQRPPQTVTQNLFRMISHLKPTDIVVWLDLDDWLPHNRVLQQVAALYDARPDLWLTYGSYRRADGRPGHCAEYPTERYRYEPWYASHLKTFRAALFQKLTWEDFTDDEGEPIQGAHDMAVMLPMLEMAGRARWFYNPEIMCIYNFANSLEHRGSKEDRGREIQAAAYLRQQKPKTRLEGDL